MSVRAEALQMHLDYSAWASARMVDAAAMLSAEELNRDFNTADKSVLGTLAHIYAADRVWLGRILGNPPAKFLDPEHDLNLDTLQTEWPALMARWKNWIVEQNDASVEFMLDYTDLRGNPHRQALWQVVLHVVNHGTHHRGQVSGMIRAMGHPPPQLDLIFYYRSTST